MRVVDAIEWACVLCGHHIQNDWASRAINLHQILLEAWTFLSETIQMIQKASAMDNWWLAASSQQCACSCITFVQRVLVKLQITHGTHLPYSPHLVPCHFCFFPKQKSHLKGKGFQTIDEIQENTTGQLMAIGRTLWGPKLSTLKGTEASSSYVQCFSYLLQ